MAMAVEASRPDHGLRDVGDPRGVVVVAVVITVFAAGLQGVIPLFPLYQERFGLQESAQTILFGTYAVTLVPVLLTVGSLSDVVGRRRVMVPAICLAVGAGLLMATAQSFGQLVVGRVGQGMAMGIFWGAAAALVRDLTPESRRATGALVVSVSFAGGLATGTAFFGGMAWASHSTSLPWLVHTGLMVVTAAMLLTVRQPWRPRKAAKILRVPRPRAPEGHERGFLWFLAPVTAATTGLAGTTIAFTPGLVAELDLRVDVSGFAGMVLALTLGMSAVAQVMTRRWFSAYTVSLLGMAVVSVGIGLVLVGHAGVGPIPTILGIVIVGGGAGLGFRGGFALAEGMSGRHNRAQVLSSFSVVIYLASGLPPMAAGYVAESSGFPAALVASLGAGWALAAVALLRGRQRLDPVLRWEAGCEGHNARHAGC